MNNDRRRQSGYSLAEILVAVAIFAIIILAALTAYDRSNRIFKTGVESSNLQQNTRVAFDKLLADVRMAGYDFDRDGIPAGSIGGTNVYQQPDEQFEYIGPAALTIRGNFDYETENQPCTATLTDNCDNGREPSYESVQFPVVTTGNDEIVTYALVPDSQTAIPACDPATNCVRFYADTHVPRKSYPDPANGGLDENVVEIPGVDLCAGGCNNPPYTLYRFTLDRAQQNFVGGANVIRTPLASNMRSLTFTYYQDAQGVAPLKDLANTTDVSTGATIEGLGPYQVANPSQLVPQRSIRAKVNSVRVTLVGLNEARDAAYTDTAETLTGGPNNFEQFRKYRLETLVSPRNVQKRGMREQDTSPPGSPTLNTVCTGACAGVYLAWTAPAVNNVQGAPDQYKVIYDTAAAPGYNCETTTFTNTFTHVFGDSHASPSCKLTPNVLYKFAVVALNSYGSATSNTVTATPLNTTQPAAPVLNSATTNLIGKVTLSWSRPISNVSGAYSCGPQIPNAAELLGYIVERQDPSTGTWTSLIPAIPAGAQVTTSSPYDTVTWTDTSVTNCIDYTYRVSAVEVCAFNAAYNSPANATLGRSPVSNTKIGSGTSGGNAPQPVADLTIDQVGATCPGLICSVTMTWPKVTKDTANNDITVSRYEVERQQVGTGTWALRPPITNGATSFTDTGVDITLGQQYWYRVWSVQCENPLVPGSGRAATASQQRLFPCNFPLGILNVPLVTTTAAFDGDGTAANPWKVVDTASADVNILQPALIQRVAVRDYDAGGSMKWTDTKTAPTYSWSWAMNANSIERLDVAVVENGGCAHQDSVYFQDEPQNCCLAPFTFDPTVVSFSSGDDFVDMVLKNICSTTLTVNSLVFTINGNRVPVNAKIDRIVFPAASGGCASDPTFGANCAVYTMSSGGLALVNSGTQSITVPDSAIGPASMPAGVTTVPVSSTNYKIRVHFTRSLTNPNQPMSGFTVNYSGTSGSAACPIN